MSNSYRNNLLKRYPDCWQWIRLASRLPGQLTDQEAASLFHLARARTPSIDPAILELGAGGGRATLLLAAGLRGKTRPRLIASEQTGHERLLYRVLERCHLKHIIETADTTASWRDAIDLLFIHTNEDEDALRSHLTLWSPFLRPGGLVVLHGVSKQPPALFVQPRYGDFRMVDNLAWATKQCSDAPNPEITRQEIAVAELQDTVRRAAKEFAENRHAIQALQRSWSWRLTAPLRWGIQAMQAIAGIAGSFGHGSPKTRLTGLAHWLRFGRLVRASGLLDERYYRDTHPGVAWARTSPLLHFFVCGANEGHKPNELFDVAYYLGRYPDVAHSGLNPLVHYLSAGAYEGRDPHPHFDSAFYLEQNPDVRGEHLNPLAHYLAPGIAEGRDPNPWFDTSEYLEKNPHVAIFGLNPLGHQAGTFSKS